MLARIDMPARKHALGLGLLLAVSTSVPALAQTNASKGEPYPTCTKKVEPAESEAAHAKYLSGKVDYDEGKHDAAIEQFRQAYAKDCTKHELLVIISRAYEFKNEFGEAIRALETYLERVPGSPDAATHRSRIETLKTKLADQKAAATAPTTTAPSLGGGNGGGSEPPPGGEMQEHTIYPWLLVGAGVVATGVGIAVIATAPEFPDNCDKATETCTRRPGQSEADFQRDQDTSGRAKDQPVWGTVVTVGGVVLVAGGLLWHFLEPTGPKDEAKTKLRPSVGPGYGGFALTGRF